MRPGVDIVVSKALPISPSPGEVARRIVRHGLAEVLAWLGEKIGPKPEDLTHAFMATDYARPASTVLFVSEHYAGLLRDQAAVEDLGHPDRATRQAAEAEWLSWARAHQAAQAAARAAAADG